MHLIGVIKNNVITMRYDWYNIINECEIFEKNYLNTTGFCESCVFYEMPSYLKDVMKQAENVGLTDCKEIAKDNDIIYTYCRERKRTKRFLRIILFFLILLLFGLVFGGRIKSFYQQKKNAFILKMNSATRKPSVV